MSEQLVPIDWHAVFGEHYGSYAHPLNPDLTVRDFPIAMRLASAMKFGGKGGKDGHASPIEAGLFWKEFKVLDMDPEHFEELLKVAAPISFRLLNRPPSMHEMSRLRDSEPHQIHKHFSDLPHPKFPDLTAGDYARAHGRAEYFARSHLGRRPYDWEARFFHHANMGADAISEHYQNQREQEKPEPTEQGEAPDAHALEQR